MKAFQERTYALMGSACPKKACYTREAIHSGLYLWATVVRAGAQS